ALAAGDRNDVFDVRDQLLVAGAAPGPGARLHVDGDVADPGQAANGVLRLLLQLIPHRAGRGRQHDREAYAVALDRETLNKPQRNEIAVQVRILDRAKLAQHFFAAGIRRHRGFTSHGRAARGTHIGGARTGQRHVVAAIAKEQWGLSALLVLY